ncbi:MAG: ABC transporter ATP-binding protein, partial [Clostridia bacterium]|nr:ABC transporter ATP-binding protein [Clostridia bacterium]
MKQYRALIRKNFGRVFGVTLSSVIASFTMVFAGYSLSFLYTAYEYEGDKTKALLYTFLIVVGIWLIAMLCYYASLLAKSRIQRRIKNELRSLVGGKIGALDYPEFTGKDCGNYVSWLTNDVDQIYSQSFASLFSGVENLATALFSLAALWLLSPYIGIAAIVLLIVISVLPQLTNKRLQMATAERSAALEVSTESYKDVVMGGPIFFLTNLRNRICERIVLASQKAEQVNFKFNRINAAVQVLISTISMIGQVLLLSVTLLAAVAGVAPAGAALSVGNLAGSFFNSAGSLVQCFIAVKTSAPLWNKFQIPASDDERDKVDISAIPAITLNNVSFQYGEHTVLKNKSYTFRAGGKYAIMGESGSGKTTLTKIILGLLPGYTGAVQYGEVEQRAASLESLYRQIAYVDQQVYLFQDTVRFNITLGQHYTDEEMEAVVEICKLGDYVAALPDGLDTVIMENGKNLSGGQRQRIALARALIR